ncbi:hypothetical protein NVP1170O_139 [Vibrio phage 1.170.O._10N.261.52.C3]|nr:hypothetical protein NVP1170O_139 [Vibrio phage 1.170.O._10N.261.52.C3]
MTKLQNLSLEEIVAEGCFGNLPTMTKEDWDYIEDITQGYDINNIDPEFFSIGQEEQ